MATGAARRGRSGRRGTGPLGRSSGVLREIGGVRLPCAASGWLGLNVVAWSRLFEPLPDMWLALSALATLGAGGVPSIGVTLDRRTHRMLAIRPNWDAPGADIVDQHWDGPGFRYPKPGGD